MTCAGRERCGNRWPTCAMCGQPRGMYSTSPSDISTLRLQPHPKRSQRRFVGERQRKTSGRHRGSAARGGERPLHTHGSWVGTDSVTVLRAPPALQVSLHRRMQTTQAWYVGLGVWGSAPRALVLHRQEGLADRRIRGPDPPALGARRRGRVSLQLQ